MRLDFSGERVLAVVAHPDDAEILCAGTLARARRDGAAIGICVLCRGDRGQPGVPIANLAAVRRREMTAAAKLLGAVLLRGEFGDGRLVDGPAQRRKLTQLYRRFRPTLVLAHWREDYHPDHRAAGALAEAVSWFCASAGHKTQAAALAGQPALWWMDTMNMTGFEPGFFVDVSDQMDLKRRLLACHKSQLRRSGDGDFAPLEQQMIQQAQARGVQAGVAVAEAFRAHLAWKRARAW
jgi:LmbE family N-acetylglucosaminyl deacetylase